MENKKTKNDIPFKREWLKRYAKVLLPGKYLLRSATNVDKSNFFTKDGATVYTMKFRAIAGDQLQNLAKLFVNNVEVPRNEIADLLMTVEVNIHNRGYHHLPLKGEWLETIVDYVEGEDGVKRLMPISFRVTAPLMPEMIDMDLPASVAKERSEIVADAIKQNEVVLEQE